MQSTRLTKRPATSWQLVGPTHACRLLLLSSADYIIVGSVIEPATTSRQYTKPTFKYL
jgi:hypothetical protein